MDDEHYLALGRAVYSFLTLEWLVIWIAALLGDGDLVGLDGLTFGPLVDAVQSGLNADPAAGGGARPQLDVLVPMLREANQLRQDVFHSHPVHSTQVLRLRKDGSLHQIDVDMLTAARERFETITEQATKAWAVQWEDAWEEAGGGDDLTLEEVLHRGRDTGR
jgi:hypothetical protein